jgi:AraC family transcriptional regulator, regulatory protein of adaptative response / DNA-3-methyladenine glycosylase II
MLRLSDEAAAAESFTLQLSYRPPFDWAGLLRFLRARALKSVERVEEDGYLRTVELGEHTGWMQVRHAPSMHALRIELTHSLMPVLPAVLARLRHVFDLSARPDVIAAHLMRDPLLADAVRRNPGLRVPGAFDGFELAVRAILGQQVTVKAATTLAGRFVEAFGERIETARADLTRLCPTPRRIAEATADEVASLGIIRTRARSIIAVAREITSGRLKLEAGAQPDDTMAWLVALPGIGTWTAQYIAMRALRWPDAFPKEDAAMLKRLGGVTAARAEELSQAWRPWRSYATLHLWQRGVPSGDAGLAPGPEGNSPAA